MYLLEKEDEYNKDFHNIDKDLDISRAEFDYSHIQTNHMRNALLQRVISQSRQKIFATNIDDEMLIKSIARFENHSKYQVPQKCKEIHLSIDGT